MQRILDLTFSGLAIVMLIPLLIPIILALKFTGEGEILYFQARVGINGKTFNLYKFATMMKNSSNIGTGDITIKNDPRVLPFGKILRKTKINELPQLWNILAGDMSLVGPRPALYNQHDLIDLREEKGINDLLPGITGLAQINGRDSLSIEEKVNYDLLYKKNHNLWLDIIIIFKTIFRVLQKKDISK